MKDIIFYSKNKLDVYSPKLLQIIKTMPFAKEFSYYCIDKESNEPNCKKDILFLFEITDVPTMYVQGKKLVGPEAFDWLEFMYNKMNGGGGGGHQQQQQQPKQQSQYQMPQQQTQYQQQQQLPQQQRQFNPYERNGNEPSSQIGLDSIGLSGMSDGGSNMYANPFDPTATTISGQQFTKQDIEHPMETKGPSQSDKMDDILRTYESAYKDELMSPVGLPPLQGGLGGFASMRM